MGMSTNVSEIDVLRVIMKDKVGVHDGATKGGSFLFLPS